ncbi:MAG: phosphatase PAP2 family protein [Candidatus Nomurabacteria bacterium]|jgi:undecaprenyl-diphosphatase|nr:phosphatase PAP2 family protein [Candidatus Nomurabacteria bacterium]
MIQFLADWLLIIVVALAAVLFFFGAPKKQKLNRAGIIIMASLTALLVARAMSFVPIDEARPFVEQGLAAGASYMSNPGFPSDHTLLAFSAAFAVLFMTKFKKLAWVLFILAALVGVGRVLALVHTPLDVFGGLVAAGFGAWWYVIYYREKLVG